MILSFIVILKCHDNRNRREIFNIVISPTQYCHKYCDYRKIHCSETFISVKYFQLIFTILVPGALLSDIMIISIIVIITLMIYCDMKFLLSPIPTRQKSVRAPEHSAPSTMASNMATVTGSVLTTGIASFLCKPCTVHFTKVDSVGEGTLAIW